MTSIAWDPEAQCELNCLALFYAKRGGEELAERFLQKVEAAIASAKAMPASYRKIRDDAQRVRVERFPFHVVFWHDEVNDCLHVLAIAHANREPGYWRDRIP